MKFYHHRIYFLIGLLLLVLAGVLAGNNWNASSIQQASHHPKKSSQQLSMIAQASSKRKLSTALNPQSAKTDFIRPWSLSLMPAPLDHPSADELREFPGARVVAADEVSGPGANETIRVRILQTHFKYPAIRTEEVIDHSSGNVVTREEMVADHLLVTLGEGEDPQNFLKKWSSSATSITRVTADAPLYILTLKSSSLSALPEAMDALAPAGDDLKAATPDFIVHGCLTPNDPGVSNWNWMFEPAKYQWGLFKIDAPNAWNVRTSASSVVVAIVDSGIRYTHQDLKANIWHDPTVTNGTICGTNAYAGNNDPMDDDGHGTFCAGIIGAVGNNHIGMAGLAWKVQLMSCKALDADNSGAMSDIISCIYYACDHGANIINFSIFLFENAALQAFQYAHDKKVIVVAAAANNSNNNDFCPEYPSSYRIASPVNPALDNIVGVAATTEDDQLAYFSNYGTNTVPSLNSVPIAAPGVNVYSTWANSDSSYNDGSITSNSGTSASAPFVTGALALMMAQFPNDSYQQLIDRLLTTADKVPALVGKVGYGRLNLAKALGYTSPRRSLL